MTVSSMGDTVNNRTDHTFKAEVMVKAIAHNSADCWNSDWT